MCSLNCAVVVDNNKVEIFGATTESQLMQICHREILYVMFVSELST